jgi:hypothetical protein
MADSKLFVKEIQGVLNFLRYPLTSLDNLAYDWQALHYPVRAALERGYL